MENSIKITRNYHEVTGECISETEEHWENGHIVKEIEIIWVERQPAAKPKQKRSAETRAKISESLKALRAAQRIAKSEP